MERYALVFGVNSFVSTILQSVLAAIIINTLQVTITLQVLLYLQIIHWLQEMIWLYVDVLNMLHNALHFVL